MRATPPRSGNGVTTAAERSIERALKEEVREELGRLLTERQLFAPDPEDEARIRALMHERVTAYQRRTATTNGVLLTDPEAMKRRLYDNLLRLKILEPLMQNPTVEKVIANEPARVFVIEDGQKRL